MKNYTSIIQKTEMLASLVFVVNCGLQVRDNPTSILNPVVNTPAEKTYTVGGSAVGIVYEGTDPGVPTGYFPNLPQEIVLTINGENFTLDVNDEFTFTKRFKSGEDYEVSILDNGIVIPNIDGVSPPIYLNCDIGNASGTIVDQNVTNVDVKCYLGDTQYPDPAN